MEEEQREIAEVPRRNMPLFLAAVLAGCFALFACALFLLDLPPSNFPKDARIEIRQGETLSEIGETLRDEHVIMSATYFELMATLRDMERSVYAGVYTFPAPISATEVVEALRTHQNLVPATKFTVIEGSTLADIDAQAAAELHMTPGSLRTLNHGEEGNLFPDTYFIAPDTTPEELLSLLRSTFVEKLAPYQDAVASSSMTEKDVITLASIVEKEANDDESMHIVAGILERRLALNMPLQVDATFAYTLNKKSSELTQEDLEKDTPYNTYTNRGLPPTPINNPGLMAIEAVLNPTKTDYLYYLSDADGAFHYAKTFDEHKDNKAKYLQ